jgi:hypothetical protein
MISFPIILPRVQGDTPSVRIRAGKADDHTIPPREFKARELIASMHTQIDC